MEKELAIRTKQAVYDLMINAVREGERIRAVYMNGSRTDVNDPKGVFQDYDIDNKRYSPRYIEYPTAYVDVRLEADYKDQKRCCAT